MYAQQSLSQTESWLNSAMARVYGYMMIGLLLTGVVAFLTYSAPAFQAAILGTPLKWVALLAPLGFVFAMSLGYNRFSGTTLRTLFLVYSAINGVSLSVIGNAYNHTTVLAALGSTVGLFGFMSVWGYFTKKDLSSMGQILFIGLIGIVIAMLVNLFIQSSMMSLIISCVAVLVFLGLTAYDTQQIRETLWKHGDEGGKATIMGALNLYLDFLNLFLHLLNILGSSKDD